MDGVVVAVGVAVVLHGDGYIKQNGSRDICTLVWTVSL